MFRKGSMLVYVQKGVYARLCSERGLGSSMLRKGSILESIVLRKGSMLVYVQKEFIMLRNVYKSMYMYM